MIFAQTFRVEAMWLIATVFFYSVGDVTNIDLFRVGDVVGPDLSHKLGSVERSFASSLLEVLSGSAVNCVAQRKNISVMRFWLPTDGTGDLFHLP